MEKEAQAPLVLVEWRDSRQPTTRWQFLSDYEPQAPCACVSVGFLIHQDEQVVAVAASLADTQDEDGMQASAITHIAVASVVRIVPLEEVGDAIFSCGPASSDSAPE